MSRPRQPLERRFTKAFWFTHLAPPGEDVALCGREVSGPVYGMFDPDDFTGARHNTCIGCLNKAPPPTWKEALNGRSSDD